MFLGIITSDALLISFFTLVIGIFVQHILIKVGIKYELVDKPDGFRKIHTKAIPLTGGYGIFFTLIISMYLLSQIGLTKFDDFNNYISTIMVCALISLIMGGYDDKNGLRPRYKILVQLMIATICYFQDIRIDQITIPFFNVIDLAWLNYPVTVFWFLGCMNVINLLDGLDGLASGVSLFAFITLLINGFMQEDMLSIYLNTLFISANLAFLIFNFNPAKVFLGDAGSMLLGFFIASMSLVSNHKAEAAVALAVPLIAMALPILDTVVAMIRRWSKRMPMSSADKKHIHHALLNSGMTQKQVVLTLYGICIVFTTISCLMIYERDSVAIVVLITVGIGVYFLIVKFRVLDIKVLKQRLLDDSKERERAAFISVAVEKSITKMHDEDEFKNAWSHCSEAFKAMAICTAKVSFFDSQSSYSWRDKLWKTLFDLDSRHFNEWSLRTKICVNDKIVGSLLLVKVSEELPSKSIFFQIEKLNRAFESVYTQTNESENTEKMPSRLKWVGPDLPENKLRNRILWGNTRSVDLCTKNKGVPKKINETDVRGVRKMKKRSKSNYPTPPPLFKNKFKSKAEYDEGKEPLDRVKSQVFDKD